MKGKWKVIRNPMIGYIVARVKNTDEAVHSGNLEYYGDYSDDKAERQAVADELNTVEALEKQIPEKPQKSESGMFDICPTCGRFINRREKPHGNIDIPRCKWCGQKLDWSDTK